MQREEHVCAANKQAARFSDPWLAHSQVDTATIAAIQVGFARNFPFQKHGERFAEISVRSSLKSIITSDGPGRLIG